jgi:hypothetical protein
MKTTKIHKALRSDKGGIAFGHDDDGRKARLPVGDDSHNLFVYGPRGRTTTAAVIINGARNRGIPVHLALPTAQHRAFGPVIDGSDTAVVSVSHGFEAVAVHLEALLASAEHLASEAQSAAASITAGRSTDWVAPPRVLVVVSDLDRIMAPIDSAASPAAALAEPPAADVARARAALAFVRLARLSGVARMTVVATSIDDPVRFLGWADGDDLVDTTTLALGDGRPGTGMLYEIGPTSSFDPGRPITCWYLPRSWARGGDR